MLKAILMDITADATAAIYVEVLSSHPEVIDFLGAFGFFDSGLRSGRSEHVLVKYLRADDNAAGLADLDFHIRYGPPALRLRQKMYVIPIEPQWHDQFFPERARVPDSAQLPLFPAEEPLTHPWGNALARRTSAGVSRRPLSQVTLSSSTDRVTTNPLAPLASSRTCCDQTTLTN